MTNIQALNLLYQVTRVAPVSADNHDQCKEAANVLANAIKQLEALTKSDQDSPTNSNSP